MMIVTLLSFLYDFANSLHLIILNIYHFTTSIHPFTCRVVYLSFHRVRFHHVFSLDSGYYDALAKLVELLRRAGKLSEGQKYLDQVRTFPLLARYRGCPKSTIRLSKMPVHEVCICLHISQT